MDQYLYIFTGHNGTVQVLAELPNCNLASGSDDSTIKIWNSLNGSLLFTFYAHRDIVYTLVTLTNGNLASCSLDKTLKIWNP